jgi:ABC-type transport system substrate-binding protein
MRAMRLLFIFCWLLAAAVAARADDPLYSQPPYDEVVLDESNGRAILRVQPLNFPGHRMPAPSDRKEDLEFELIDRPGEKFAVPWVNVADIRFFESLVLAEADVKVKEGRFDEAQAYFLFLEKNHKDTPGLSASIENLLYVQVGAAFRAQRYDEALALLVELYGRNPARQGVSTAYERVTAELVKGHIAAGRYAAARGLLRNLGERYPATKTTTVATYETQLTEQAAALLAQATAAKAASKPREAYEAVHKAIALWPTLAGASELARSLHQEYPVIAVGVISPLTGPATHRLDDWAANRTSRLVATPLAAPSADGAAYSSPLGELARGEDPRQVTLKLRDDLKWATPPRKLGGQDIVRCLLAAADPKHAQYDPLWASVIGGVTAGVSEVRIDFLRPQPLPEAWLVRPIWWDGGPATCGPYQLESHAGGQSRFIRQPGYFAAAGIQVAEITERTYPGTTAALAALKRGEISLIDRVSPWDVAAASATSGVSVRRYAAPTVHVLIPNPNKPLVASRTMRRALLYSIDRDGILRRGLVGGLDLPGCEVISGPLPRGAADDRFAYGYDAKIEPRPYEPGTGLLLAQLAIGETLGANKSPPPLVLAYPAEPVSRAACQSIARQLKLLNLQVTLKEAKPGELPALADCDLLYAELAIREPVVDAWRLLGPAGMAGSCSPAMLLALRQVEAAVSKQEAAAKLQAVHRLAAAELPVIPLWQLAEHFAVHTSVQGVAERPGSLYEGVEKWQAELRVPE